MLEPVAWALVKSRTVHLFGALETRYARRHGLVAPQEDGRQTRLSRRPVPDCHARHEGRPFHALRHLRLRAQRRRRDGADHQPDAADAVSGPARATRHHERAGGDPPAGAGPRFRRAQWRTGRPQPRLRPAFGRLPGGIVADRFRRHLPDRDRRHIARHLVGPRAPARADGARLFGLGRRPAGKRDRREWLADLPGKRRASVRHRHRAQIRPDPRLDRHRSGASQPGRRHA